MLKKLSLKLGTLLLVLSSHVSTLATDPLDLIRLNYEYYDDDITAIWNARLANEIATNQVVVIPASPIAQVADNAYATAAILPNVQSIINGANNRTAIFPINTGGHWVALAIQKNTGGNLTVVYIDSGGAALTSLNAAGLTELRNQLNAANAGLGNNIIDASFSQQTGPACGAFTAENGIVLAKNDLAGLTAEQVRALIAANVGSDKAVRRTHFLNLYGDVNTTDVTILKPRSEVAANRFSSQNRTLANGINNVTKILNDRVVNANNFSAVAAGENDPKFGVWVKGMMGVGSDEDGTNSTNSENTSSSHSSFKGVVIGGDAEVINDTTIGLAFSRIETKSKYKLLYIDTNQDKITHNIYSLYGSSYITDDIMINASVAAGKIKVKSEDYLLSGTEIKQSGNLLSGSLTTNYKLYSGTMMSATPRIGVNLNHLDLGGYQRNSIKVSNNKQRSVDAGIGTDVVFMRKIGSMRILPKVSLDYSRIVWSNGSKLNITNLNGTTIIDKKVVIDKNIFKVGAGLTIEATNNVEVSTGYEFSGQGNSTNHLGYAKFRFNF
jgi:hypothetical protein